MGIAAQPTRANRTITVDFRSEATYFQLEGDNREDKRLGLLVPVRSVEQKYPTQKQLAISDDIWIISQKEVCRRRSGADRALAIRQGYSQ
jgi:hypothetical protein